MSVFFTCIAKGKEIYYIPKKDRFSGKIFSADSHEFLRKNFEKHANESNSAILSYNAFRDIITITGDESTYNECVYDKIKDVVLKEKVFPIFNLDKKLNFFKNEILEGAPKAEDISFILENYKHFVYPEKGNTTYLYVIQKYGDGWKIKDDSDLSDKTDIPLLRDLWKIYLAAAGKQYRTFIRSIFYRNQLIAEATSETLEAAINCYSKKFFPIILSDEEKEFIRLWDDCNVIALEKPFQLYWDERKIRIKEL